MEKKESKFNAKTLAMIVAIVMIGYMAGSASIDTHIHEANERDAYKDGKLNFDTAPLFTLPSLNGKIFSLKDHRGKWVFINFWATWCGPCVLEMPQIEKMHQMLKNDNFEVVGINVEDIEPEDVRKFADNLKLTFTILLDTKEVTGPLYGVNSLPFSLVVNPTGEVVATAIGMREWDSPPMIEYMKGLMKDSRASGNATLN